MLIGRRGDLIAPNDIIRRLGIVDIERYRQIVYSLQTKSLIETSVTKNKASRIAEQKKISVRDVPRCRIKQSREITHLRGDHSKARNGASLKNDAFPRQVALPTPVEGKRMISENKTLMKQELYIWAIFLLILMIETLSWRSRSMACQKTSLFLSITGSLRASRLLSMRMQIPRGSSLVRTLRLVDENWS